MATVAESDVSMIIWIPGTPLCPCCGSPHPLRIADSCGYCEDCPEIRGEMLQIPEWAESLKLEYRDLSPSPKMPEILIWATSTDMAGSAFQRKTYFMKLVDGDKEIVFSLQVHANGAIAAVPYVPPDYSYTDYDNDTDDEDNAYDDGYVAEEDWEDDTDDDGVFYYD